MVQRTLKVPEISSGGLGGQNSHNSKNTKVLVAFFLQSLPNVQWGFSRGMRHMTREQTESRSSRKS